jgi:uncharacterized integral membrane protein (TIGR00698 family)
MAATMRLAPGLALAGALAMLAWRLGQAMPLLGGAVLAILLGVLLRAAWTPWPAFDPGVRFAGKRVLQASIVLLGFGLDLGQVARTGLESLGVTVATLLLAFAAAWGLGRALKVPVKLAALVGVGTAICGGSAIAAVAPILKPDEHDTAFAISTIFLFNLVAVLVFPPLGHLLGMSDAQFGLWAGTAINDTSSVVAAGYAYSAAAGDQATIVKLARATMIIPVCLALAGGLAWRARRAAPVAGASASPRASGAASTEAANGGTATPSAGLGAIFPWFILWFVVASALRTLGFVPEALQGWLHAAGGLAMVLALAAIGLSADLRRMRATGPRPVLLGLGVWATVAIGSLVVQAL